MSKKLEELFGMTSSEDFEDEDARPEENVKRNLPAMTETSKILDKIDAALPSVRDLSASDEEMDELAKLSKEAFENLMDVGLSVDPRFGGQILQTASAMMTNAINAKNAKIEKKLRMVELQLRKASLDQKERALALKIKPDEDDSDTGTGVVMDRNALLREILANSTKKDK